MNNTAPAGGGFYITYTDKEVVIENCYLSGNSALSNRGGGIQAEGWFYINNSMIIGNTAMLDGGGICIWGAQKSKISNCLIANNSATEYGGGIMKASAEVYVTNCTIVDNNASQGGGIYTAGINFLTIINSIIWSNGSNPLMGNSVPLITYTDMDFDTGDWGNNMNQDPIFVTGTYGAYYLSQTAAGQSQQSPCVDAGSASASSFGLDTRTTRTDGVTDQGVVDLGFHYPVP